MKTVIIGAGAMGCLYAAMLARAGKEVWLRVRNKAHADTIRTRGLLIEESDRPWHIPFERITSEPALLGGADIVILFVKAYDTAEALSSIAGIISDKTTVVTLQNGLGNVEHIRRYVPEHQILAGTTAHGANVVSTGHVRHAGVGETVFGPVTAAGKKRVGAVKELFEQAGITATIANDVNVLLWGKLIVNIGINPLTAIMRIKNGQILDYPPLRETMHKIVQEGAAVAAALGVTLPYPDPVRKVEDVCKATAQNISSMHQDIRAGRKTEIGQINGAVVSYGDKLEVPTPVNSMLANLVQTMEQLK